jgi:hypothetical protein
MTPSAANDVVVLPRVGTANTTAQNTNGASNGEAGGGAAAAIPKSMPRSTAARLRLLVTLAALGYAACCGAMLALPRQAFLAHTLVDDAYYYLEIAGRAAASPWPSFDGIHVTTGFHPLWALLLAPIARLLPADGLWLPRVAAALSSLLMFMAAWRFTWWVKRTHGQRGAALAALVSLGCFGMMRLGWMAMEGPLALWLAVLWLERLDEVTLAGRRRLLETAVLGGLMVLARLDMILLLAAGLALLAWRSRSLDRAMWLGSGAALLVSPALLWNYALTGHVSSTSSATKQWVVHQAAHNDFGGRWTFGFVEHVFTWGVRNAAEILKLAFGGVLAGPMAAVGGDYPTAVDTDLLTRGATVLAVALLAAAAWRIGGRFGGLPLTPRRATLGFDALIVAATLHWVAASVLLPGQAGIWYWGLELFAVAALCVRIALRARHPLVRRSVWCVGLLQGCAAPLVLLGMVLAAHSGRLAKRSSFATTMSTLSDTLRVTVPAPQLVGSCNAGALGFMSERPVVNLDGLVNDWSFLEARRKGAVRQWIERRGIRWYADCVPRERQQGYLDHLGYRRDEVRFVQRLSGRGCEGILLDLRPAPESPSETTRRARLDGVQPVVSLEPKSPIRR